MTNPAPAIALNSTTYASASPYITAEEYLSSATGVDTSQLIPGGNAQANATALNVIIRRASSWADSICNQVLAATTDIQSGTYRVNRDSAIRVPLDNSPVLAVTAASVGFTTSTMTALTTLADVAIKSVVATIPVPIGSPDDRLRAAVSYVNGWANTTAAAAVAAGATSLVVADGTGIFPGVQLTFYDATTTETVTVAATGWTFGSTTVPLAAATVFAHDVGTSASAFPASIKQAVVSLTSCLIRTRGAEALSMAAFGAEPAATELVQSGGFTDLEIAVELLNNYRRMP